MVYLEEVYPSSGEQTEEAFERTATATDDSSQVYLAGSKLNQYGWYDLLLTKYDDEGDLVWSKTFNVTDTTGNVIVGDIALGPAGNIVVTGTVYNGTTNDYDVLTIKYDPGGNKIWDQTYNGNASYLDGGTDLVIDDSDNAFVIGGITDTANMQDIVVIRYDSLGTEDWVTTVDGFGYFDVAGAVKFTGSNYSGLRITAAVQKDLTTWSVGVMRLLTSDGSVYTSLITQDSADLDEIKDATFDVHDNIYVTGYRYTTPGQQRDVVTVKLDSTLNLKWEKTYDGGNSLDDEPEALAVDDDGNVAVIGYATTTTEKDLLILRYNSNGHLNWSKKINGPDDADDVGYDVEVDSTEVLVCGYQTTHGTRDYYTAIVQWSNGNLTWEATYNGIYNRDDVGRNIFRDEKGNLLIAGVTGLPDGKTDYTLVKYQKADLFLPDDGEAPSSNIRFVRNNGQLKLTNDSLATDILYYSNGVWPDHYFSRDSVCLVFNEADTSTSKTNYHRISIGFLGKDDRRTLQIQEEANDYFNFYLGHIPEGRERVPLANALVHFEVIPGIDFHYQTNNAGLKYTMVVKPGTDADDITLAFQGQDSLSVDSLGRLILHNSIADYSLEKPIAFLSDSLGNQDTLTWEPSFSLASNLLSFNTSTYDTTKYLVIVIKSEEGTSGTNDGNIDWSTYYSGTTSKTKDFWDVRTDEFNNVFVVGSTLETDMPGFDGYQQTNMGDRDAFVIKFNNDGERKFGTYFGGSGKEEAYGIEVDPESNSYIVGYTTSQGSFPKLDNGTAYHDDENSCSISACEDSFFASFTASGSLRFATFYGESEPGRARDIRRNSEGDFFVTGYGAADLQSTTEPFETTEGNAYIAKFSGAFEPIWASQYGETTTEGGTYPKAIAIDSEDNVFIAGVTFGDDTLPSEAPLAGSYDEGPGGEVDGFILKITHDPIDLVWSTHYGGDEIDRLEGIVVDNNDDVYVCGRTKSTDIDTWPPNVTGAIYNDALNGMSYDCIFAKFDNDGVPQWATYFGGTGEEQIYDVEVDRDNNVYFPGWSTSTISDDTESYLNYYYKDTPSLGDGFIAMLTPDAVPVWITYFGGSDLDNIYASDISDLDQLYITGLTGGNDAPSGGFPLVDLDGSASEDAYYQDDYQSPGLINVSGFLTRFVLEISSSIDWIPLQEQTMSVFPNPTTSGFSFQISEPDMQHEPARLLLFNAAGQMMYQKEVILSQEPQEVNDLPGLLPGTYFIVLRMTEERKFFRSRLLIVD
jgi:hypothetical protein